MTYLPLWSCIFIRLNGFEGRFSNTYVELYWKFMKTIYISRYKQKPSRFIRYMIQVIPKLASKIALDKLYRSNSRTPISKSRKTMTPSTRQDNRTTPQTNDSRMKPLSSLKSADNPLHAENWKGWKSKRQSYFESDHVGSFVKKRHRNVFQLFLKSKNKLIAKRRQNIMVLSKTQNVSQLKNLSLKKTNQNH